MKTKLPNEYSNLAEYHYDVRLNKGLYYTLSRKYLKLNCKNFSIKPKDEITISTLRKFSIITFGAIGRTKVQYLVTIEFDERVITTIPERNLPVDLIEYLTMAKDNIVLYNNMIQ